MAAMEDEEVDLYADPDKGEAAYLPREESQVRMPLEKRGMAKY